MGFNDSPTSLVRSLKGAPLACLFILLLEGTPLRAGALCQATGYSPNTITAALRLLADLHLLEKTPDGWRIPFVMRDALLKRSVTPLSFANREAASSNRESMPIGGGGSESSEEDSEPSPPATPASIFATSPSASGFLQPSTEDCQQPTGGLASVLQRRHLAILNRQQSTDNDQQIARILDATRLLFGERLHGPPSRYPDVRLLLASIAEAYVRRDSLRKPARVVYANLKNGVDPGGEYLTDPLSYLPANFLSAIGLPARNEEDLPEGAEENAGADDQSGDNFAGEEALPLGFHPSLALFADARAQRCAAEVWEIARETLRGELPRHVYQAHLEGCYLATYDPAAGVFTLAVADELQGLWLQERLATRITRLLTGICDRPCSVCFEVPP